MRDTKPRKSNRNTERLSPDRKWRSFPKVPNLLQYVNTGLYYARVKVNGKLIRRGLNTKVFEDAKLLLHDFLKRETGRRHVTGAPVTMGEARGLYEASLDSDRTLSAQSVYYRKNCIKRLLKSWPELDGMKPRAITRQQCEKWAAGLAVEVDAQYFNNILATLKFILSRAGITKDTGSPLYDEQGKPTVNRMGIELVPPTLPEPDQFLKIIEAMETSGAGQQQECADFARFLAYSGCRLSEARAATFADVDLSKGLLTVHNAKVRRARNWKPTRLVPIIPDMRRLLERLQKDRPEQTDPICKVGECEKSLVRACKLVKVPRLTHHDLRHLFATRCIEAGVDIPTVSRWLGHSDGGALAMKVYGHLREKHSAEMAQKVTFEAKPVIPMPKEAV
jgi:integrase